MLSLVFATAIMRLLQWRTLHTLRQPIVWILTGLPVVADGVGTHAALLGGYSIAAFWL